MAEQTADNSEKMVSVGKARIIILIAVLAYLSLGIAVGYLYFWRTNQSNRYDAEIKNAVNTVVENPDDINARINLGFKYMKAGKYKEAKAEYNAALQIDANNILAQLNMAYLYIQTKDYSSADSILTRLSTDDPGFQVYFLLGKSKYLQKKYPEAVQNLLSARDTNPTDTETLYYLGLSYKGLGNKDEAVKVFKRALEFDPNRKDVQNELARLGVK